MCWRNSIALLLLAFTPALAAEPSGKVQTMTLGQAIESAVRRNLNIAVTGYEPLIARSDITSALGRFDPTFESSFHHFEEQREDPFFGVGLENQSRTGIRGLLPWGTDYRFGFNSRWLASNNHDSSSRYQSTLQLGITQPLLRDFGTDANLSTLRIARANQRISEWQLRQQVIDTITRVHYVYNALHFAKEDLEVAKRSRALAQTLMEDNIQRTNIGVMSPLDITTARAEVAAREEAVILAERAVRDNENYLKQLTTDDTEALLTTRLNIVPPPTVSALDFDVRAGIRDALELRPDYRQAILDIERRNIRLAFDRNQLLPRLDVSATLDLLGLDNDFSGSLKDSADRERTSWSAGAVFSLPIPNRAARGRLEAAKLEAAQAVLDLKRLEQEIIVRIDNAAGQILTNRQRIASTRESVRLAKESLQAGQERLSLGTSTTFEVLELQKRLAEAEVAELRARTDYNRAIAEFDRQTGTTLERNGVRYLGP